MEYVAYMNLLDEQCRSWKADSLLAGQEMRLLLWKLKVHYYVQRTSARDPIVSHLDLVSTHIIFLNPLYCNFLSLFPWGFRTEMYLSLLVLATCPAAPIPYFLILYTVVPLHFIQVS
jgi:hypothetical protein